MEKRVVLIRSNPVSPDPPVEKVADTLIVKGYDVSIIGWDRGSDIAERNEMLLVEHGAVKIVRLGIPAMFDGGFKKNFFPLIKFQIRLYKWLKKHKQEYDIIHAFDFDTGFIANKFTTRYNKQLIYHVLDFYVDSHNFPNDFIKLKVKKAEFTIINNSNATIICTEKRRVQIQGTVPRKLEIVHNTPKSVTQISDDYSKIRNSNRLKIVYVGILAESRFLKEIISCVEKDDRFEFHIGGFGVLEEYIAEAAKKCERIFYYGKLPYDKTLSLEQECDIMLAIYDPSIENHKFAAPNKFYESLMLGKPVVMAKNTGMSQVVEDAGIGVLIDYSKEGFIEGINKLIDMRDEWKIMGEKMKKLYNEQFSWVEMEKRLLKLYEDICNEENSDCQ